MRIDYFDDLLPGGVTRVTHQKKDCVTPETDSATSKNSGLTDASRMSRMSRTKTGNTEHNEAIAEHLAERAAIQEYDGGLTRKQAEAEARRALRVFEYRLTENPDSWLVLIAPGCDLDEARESLRQRFGNRLLDTRKHNAI
jgi:hypothetical protein